MKKITLFGGGALVLGITIAILASASAGSVVFRDIAKGTLTAGQASTYFSSFAAANCPAGVSTVTGIRVRAIDAGYGFKCIVQISLTPGQAEAQMALAEADPNLTVAVVGIDGDNFLVRGALKGTLTAGQASSYFGSYAADKCFVSASKVNSITVGKQSDGTYEHKCIGVDSQSIEDARDQLQALAGNEDHQIEIIGRVTE